MIKLERVIEHFGVDLLKFSPVTENVYYITDGKHEYALKKSSLTKDSVNHWENVFHQTYRLNLLGILPVYLTKEEKLYCIVNNEIYYLTPWVKSIKDKLNFEHFFKYLGKIHQTTKYYQTISYKNMKDEFGAYLVACEKNYQFILSTVEQFEKNKYMSPFELLVCTQFVSLKRVYHVLKGFIKRFIENREDETTWNVSLCHGNLSCEHILQSNQPLFINWEKSCYHHSTYDLSIFFRNTVKNYGAEEDSLLEMFDYYMKENELRIDELYLLAIYLLDMQKYISILKSYLHRKQKRENNFSVIEQTKLLNQTHRQLMFALKFADLVDEKEDDLLLDDFDS